MTTSPPDNACKPTLLLSLTSAYKWLNLNTVNNIICKYIVCHNVKISYHSGSMASFIFGTLLQIKVLRVAVMGLCPWSYDNHSMKIAGIHSLSPILTIK